MSASRPLSRHRTLPHPTATRPLAVFLRSISKQRAQPTQLLRPGFGPFGEYDARAARQRVDIAAAMSLKRIKSFCAAKPAQKLGWGDAGAGLVGGQDLYGNFR